MLYINQKIILFSRDIELWSWSYDRWLVFVVRTWIITLYIHTILSEEPRKTIDRLLSHPVSAESAKYHFYVYKYLFLVFRFLKIQNNIVIDNFKNINTKFKIKFLLRSKLNHSTENNEIRLFLVVKCTMYFNFQSAYRIFISSRLTSNILNRPNQ